MENQKTFVVVMGVPSIKKYVFGTDKLVEIRGASALLDDLNRNKTEDFMMTRANFSHVKRVFAGGGAAQFIVKAEKSELERCLRELEGIFFRESRGGLRLTCGVAEYSGDDYTRALKRAFHKSEEERYKNPILPQTMIHTGYIRECESCSGPASIATPKKGAEKKEKLLCEVCHAKMEYSEKKAKKGLWDRFELFLSGQGFHVKRPRDFEKIGDMCLARRGYTALVYADGNAMGKLVKEIENKEQFEYFSKTVEDSIRDACHEALYEVFSKVYMKNARETPGSFPAEILLLGGDDLLVYLTADMALPFAALAARKFNEKTREKIEAYKTDAFFQARLKGKGLTISLGIAYGKSHTPFSILLDQSEELLKLAKKAGSRDGAHEDFYSPAYIDFHMTSNYNQVRVKDSRAEHLNISQAGRKPIKISQKPYSLEDAEALFESAQRLRDERIPKTRLNRLGHAPTLGKINGTLECLKLFTRSRPGPQRRAIWDALERFDCVEGMPWKENFSSETGKTHHSTVLVDMIEIAGFCK